MLKFIPSHDLSNLPQSWFTLLNDNDPSVLDVSVYRLNDCCKERKPEHSIQKKFVEMFDLNLKWEVHVTEANSGEGDQPEVEGVHYGPIPHLTNALVVPHDQQHEQQEHDDDGHHRHEFVACVLTVVEDTSSNYGVNLLVGFHQYLTTGP